MPGHAQSKKTNNNQNFSSAPLKCNVSGSVGPGIAIGKTNYGGPCYSTDHLKPRVKP